MPDISNILYLITTQYFPFPPAVVFVKNDVNLTFIFTGMLYLSKHTPYPNKKMRKNKSCKKSVKVLFQKVQELQKTQEGHKQ